MPKAGGKWTMCVRVLGETAEGYRASFWGNENVLRLIWRRMHNSAYTRCH